MLSFASPIWLAGLLVIPLIWWLHRLGDSGAATPVSAAFLFYTKTEEPTSSRSLPRANRLWILRAILLSLLVLALARLTFPQKPDRSITVWFDDSLSMFAIEEGQTRLTIAAGKLAAALDEVDPEEVEIRMLSKHQVRYDATAPGGESRADAIDRWAGLYKAGSPRIPFTLPWNTENWLVSDGADQNVNDWMNGSEFSHKITVGSLTENTAITAIMARRSLLQNTSHHGLVRINNLGVKDSKRTFTVRADDQVILSEAIEINPGGETYRNFRIPVGAAMVSAMLLPSDALALDDTLEVALDALRPIAVDIDQRCGLHLVTALNAHPGLDPLPGGEQRTELTVVCGPSAQPSNSASISVQPAINYQAVTGPVQWHQPVPGLDNLFLDHSWLQLNPDAARTPSEHTLLSVPDMERSLIDVQSGAVDVFLDLESAPVVERLEYPLLVNTLVELAVGRPLLDPVARETRNPAESSITSRLPGAVITDSLVATKQVRTDMSPYLLVLAILLLLADVIICLPPGTLHPQVSRSAA